MDRRTFVASATAIGLAAGGGALAVRGGVRGERVSLSGWMTPVSNGPGHLYAFCSEAGEEAVVLPADASTMRAGKVTVRGRLFRAKFKDQPTGHAGRNVLTEATLA